MGYTHRWFRSDHTAPEADTYNFYAEFTRYAVQIIQTAQVQGIQLADPSGEHLGAWRVDGDSVRLNGYGENSHESFVWEKVCPKPDVWVGEDAYFDFCKTNRKPYDTVVTALLVAVSQAYGDTVSVSSDGSPSEWEDGVRLFQEATGLVATVPFEKVTA
jgi:hypothetical protein